MDTLFSLKVFRQVVECGSFTKAADKLNISNAMASKYVSHLEKSIGAKLLMRNSRSLHLTEAGSQYYRESSYALDMLDNAAEKAAGGREVPQGELKITAPLWFANDFFAAYLCEYSERYPDVSLNITLENKLSNLIAEGYDLALRVSREPNPSLIVRKLGEVHFYMVASAAYAGRYGLPEDIAGLAQHRLVLPAYTAALDVLEDEAGRQVPYPMSHVMRSNNSIMIHSLIRSGAGIGFMPEWLARGSLADGSLHRVLPQYRHKGVTLYAAYTDRAYLTAKVRSFIDFIAEKSRQYIGSDTEAV
ncbi:LysR family transcriptional regulator [Neisseria leonii]|uniref:LysR family transcriptional regulator n=1 Tax=Neisseria leonii TaxID=2995413 RepID=UPI00237C38C4|nr:LysR family transcriptional regulator [Neisseria sp. 3986]MDD9324870.1 LysR family transcriptional regulator [Neisseria sp. 3986]